MGFNSGFKGLTCKNESLSDVDCNFVLHFMEKVISLVGKRERKKQFGRPVC